ncbi:MAG: CpaD family pilus assembly lipoprotein [Kiloniellaceae bacterium]
MRDLNLKGRIAALALLLAAGTLAGCHLQPAPESPVDAVNSHLFDSANWQQMPRPIESQVEPITLVHTVQFDADETELDEAELAALIQFLEEGGVHDGARIEIDGPRDAGGYHDPLTAARLAAVEGELASIGLRSEVPTRPRALLAKPDDRIAVTVTRAMVILPDCSAPQPPFATRPAYAYTCANAATLGLMIADPVDLARGRATGPADGEAATLSIRRYRAGKTTPLRIEGTQ